MKITLAFALVTTALAAGCGSSTSTVFGDGGAGGTGGGGGGTTTGTAGCPDQMPNNGDPCGWFADGLTCNYGECCPAIATCVEGVWQTAVSGCAELGCPYEPPAQGEACDSACGPSTCSWSNVCPDGTGQIDAICTGQGWNVSTTICATSFACGPSLTCDSATEICVATTNGGPSGEPSYACQPNPCGAIVDCGCAAPVCNELQCTGVTGHTVSCECTQCG